MNHFIHLRFMQKATFQIKLKENPMALNIFDDKSKQAIEKELEDKLLATIGIYNNI